MGASQRRKGAVAEREVAGIFALKGWPRAKRSGEAGQPDGDLDHIPEPYYAEVRRREKIAITTWIKEAEEKCPPDRVPLLIYRRSRMRWRVDLDLDDFIDLLLKVNATKCAPPG